LAALALVERFVDFFVVLGAFLVVAISVAPRLWVPESRIACSPGVPDRGSRLSLYESDSYRKSPLGFNRSRCFFLDPEA
jgi:hypothetical protein